jgi:aryl-alcohol dehydrogenase-like predicted oxidoreductase
MRQRTIGSFSVSALGLGCMNLSHAYDVPPPRAAARRLLLRALELGVTHFDTAALYGFGANEELVSEVLSPHRSRLTLASKGGMNGDTGRRVIDGTPSAIIAGCEQSLRRLRTDVIDLYYLHRWDKKIPIEESMGAMAELVRAGKVRALGLSEVSAQTLRRAHAVHPIAAVQSEYSLWTRNPEIAVLGACRELGARLVAFSPIARGWLSGKLRDVEHFAAKDLRRAMPRFQAPYFEANRPLLDEYLGIAHELGCTPAQLALAWLLARGPDVIPLTGTRSIDHLEENLGADAIELTASTLARLDALFQPSRVAGHRYSLETQLEIDTEDFVTAGTSAAS